MMELNRPRNDLSGKTFNNIYVVEFSRRDSRNNYYLCRCIGCGAAMEIRSDHISKQKSCLACANKRKIVDMTNLRYGRLTVVSLHHRDGRKAYWECKCDCGKTTIVRNCALTSGNTKSCGCLGIESRHISRTRGGRTPSTTEYNAWCYMKTRCYNTNIKRAPRYSGRGIKVCERWLNSFENFYEDMGKKPSPKHSLDRINNDGDYEPSNCRWATWEEQANNSSNNVKFIIDGEAITRANLCKKYGINYSAFRHRVAAGWTLERIISTPIRKISKKNKIN